MFRMLWAMLCEITGPACVYIYICCESTSLQPPQCHFLPAHDARNNQQQMSYHLEHIGSGSALGEGIGIGNRACHFCLLVYWRGRHLELRAWGSFRTGRPSWPSDSWCLDPKAFAAVILFARSDKTVWPRCGFCALEVLPGDLTNCQSHW